MKWKHFPRIEIVMIFLYRYWFRRSNDCYIIYRQTEHLRILLHRNFVSNKILLHLLSLILVNVFFIAFFWGEEDNVRWSLSRGYISYKLI